MPALKIGAPPASDDEARDYFPVSFWYYHRSMGNILQRNGFTLEALGKLRAGDGQYVIEPAVFTTHMHGTSMPWWSWKDLMDIKGVGPKRLLELVNYLRSIKTELPWFADFDEFTKDWAAPTANHGKKRNTMSSNGWTWDAESQRWVVRRGTILVTARYPEDLAPEINAGLFAAQMAGGEVCALPHWLLSVIQEVDAHLDADTGGGYQQQPLASHWSRVTKVCEESGEVWKALSLATGENPRKGYAGSWDDVLAELGDTMSAAACAIQHITKDPAVTEAVVIAAFRKAARRLAEHQERVLAGN